MSGGTHLVMQMTGSHILGQGNGWICPQGGRPVIASDYAWKENKSPAFGDLFGRPREGHSCMTGQEG